MLAPSQPRDLPFSMPLQQSSSVRRKPSGQKVASLKCSMRSSVNQSKLSDTS